MVYLEEHLRHTYICLYRSYIHRIMTLDARDGSRSVGGNLNMDFELNEFSIYKECHQGQSISPRDLRSAGGIYCRCWLLCYCVYIDNTTLCGACSH